MSGAHHFPVPSFSVEGAGHVSPDAGVNFTGCLLLVDAPQDGTWNMAVDEALLEAAAERGEACWRFYAWSEPTLSLGYFQDYADRGQHAASGTCPAVRRLTGGGAILHDAELTYSLLLPSRHPLAGGRDCLYAAVHECLVEALGELGIVSGTLRVPSGQRHTECAGCNPAFLCFHRRAPGDVLLGAHKIAGSAQRRRRGAVLQHGSVLLRRSAAAPELPGLEDLAGRPVGRQAIQSVWLQCVGARLGMRWYEGSLSPQDASRADTLVRTRYGRSAWTEERRVVG